MDLLERLDLLEDQPDPQEQPGLLALLVVLLELLVCLATTELMVQLDLLDRKVIRVVQQALLVASDLVERQVLLVSQG